MSCPASLRGSNAPAKKAPSSFSIIVIFICLAIVGISLIPLLSIQLNPSARSHQLSVNYAWYNASPRIIEQEVTSRLEAVFSSMKGIKRITSTSYKGYGNINLEFKSSANLDAIRFEISNLIRQTYADLPSQVSYPVIVATNSNPSSEVLLTYTLNAPQNSFQIQKYAEKNIVPALNTIKGIDQIQVYGATPYHWQIQFSTSKIQELGIKSGEITQTINRYLGKEFLGKANLQKSAERYVNEIGLTLEYKGFDSLDWNRIPLKEIEGRIIYLRDVAEVKYKEQVPQSYYRINGLNTINLVIRAQKGVNSIEVAKNIQNFVADLKARLPSGYSIITSYDSTEYLSKELNKILIRSSIGLGILLLFVLLFSRNFSYLLLIAISLLINLSMAAILYYLLHIELQLYSLAGLTISFGLIIDNSIVMIDHYGNTGNKKVFLAMLGSALTIMGALCIIFLLEEEQRANLTDFAIVIIVSLSVSLSVSLFLIPALMGKIHWRTRRKSSVTRSRRSMVKFGRWYSKFIVISKRWRWAYVVFLVFSFGIPFHWLPEKIEGETTWANLYNATFGSEAFIDEYKPKLEVIAGGAIRLFTQNIFEKSYYAEPSRTTLFVRASMPEGCTVQQLNETIEKMENVVSQYDELEMFQTSVSSYRDGGINIYFKEAYESTGFPFQLKSELERNAIKFGGADWSIYGVGQGFSNRVGNDYKNSKILLEGYNYDELYRYAGRLSNQLLKNSRVKDLEILGSDNWGEKNEIEYHLAFNAEQFALNKVTPIEFYDFLNDKVYESALEPVYVNNERQPVTLISDAYGTFDVWSFNNEPVKIADRMYKMSQFGKIEKKNSSSNVYRYNQQYQLVVNYNFVGSGEMGEQIRNSHIHEMNKVLPVGYRAFSDDWFVWDKDNKMQYYLIALVMAIIYVICAILFESLLQPLAIIALIPISFIGLFLTFYLFDINFDQGGFAAFILLCGVVVNAGLYITNDFNNFRKKHLPLISYIRAFNYKIRPILLVLVSNMMAFIPFIYQGQKEVFWFAFAAGSIGGFLFSLIGILIYLPLFLKLKSRG
jgi:multidrug efflux pump subunit AcrB